MMLATKGMGFTLERFAAHFEAGMVAIFLHKADLVADETLEFQGRKPLL